MKYANGRMLEHYLKYGYDRASNRTFRQDLVAQSHGKNFDEFYEYDGLHRLKKFHRGRLVDNNTAIESPALQQGWVLDATGNWRNFTQNDQADADRTLDQQRLHNRVNEITQIARTVGENWATPEYDRNGNMTVMPQGNDPTLSFQNKWDAWNRLVKVMDGVSTVAQYAYDGQNWRTEKVAGGTTRHYFYTSQWQVIEERTNAATTSERQFVWGLRYIDDHVLRDRAPSERLYGLQDANWNMAAIVNAAGSVQERYSYTAYGVSTVLNSDFTPRTASSFAWETRYAGYRFEVDIGMEMVRNRNLLAVLGRWLSRDPRGQTVGDSNLLWYGRDNPLRMVDPMGTDIFDYADPDRTQRGSVAAITIEVSSRRPCCPPSDIVLMLEVDVHAGAAPPWSGVNLAINDLTEIVVDGAVHRFPALPAGTPPTSVATLRVTVAAASSRPCPRSGSRVHTGAGTLEIIDRTRRGGGAPPLTGVAQKYEYRWRYRCSANALTGSLTNCCDLVGEFEYTVRRTYNNTVRPDG